MAREWSFMIFLTVFTQPTAKHGSRWKQINYDTTETFSKNGKPQRYQRRGISDRETQNLQHINRSRRMG